MSFGPGCVLGCVLAAALADEWFDQLWRQKTIPQLVDQLGSFDVIEEELARRQLYARADAAGPLLLAQLGEEDPRLKERLLKVLSLTVTAAELPQLAPLAGDPHPAVRRRLATAFGRFPLLFADISTRFLDDPYSGVTAVFLEEVRAAPLPVRRRFAERHLERLARLCLWPDPKLRRRSLELLLISDSEAAERQVLSILPQLTRSERERLWTNLARRTPDYGREFAAFLVEWQSVSQEAHYRLALALSRLQGNDGPQTNEQWKQAILTAIGQKSEEQAAALALLGRQKETLGELIPELLPELIDSEHLASLFDLYLKLRGPRTPADFATLAPRWREREAVVLEMLSQFPRLPSERTARELEIMAGKLGLRYQDSVVEAALRLPVCEARNRILLQAIQSGEPRGRLRAFDGLARLGATQYLSDLIETLQLTSDPRDRSQMVKLIAEHFGATEPEEVLRLLSGLMESDTRLDRRAALSAIPFVGLGGKTEAIAAYLAEQFVQQEPHRILLVLGQLGGQTAEQVFVELNQEFQSAGNDSLRAFLLSQAGNLSSHGTRQILHDALEEADTEMISAAFRALIQRRDPVVLQRGKEIFTRLASGERSLLIRDLTPFRNSPGLVPLMQDVLARFNDNESRIAVWELLTPAHEPMVLSHLKQDLEQQENEVLKFAAIDGLGRLGTQAARTLLLEQLKPVRSAGPAALARISEQQFLVARAAAIALAGSGAEDSAELLVDFLYRIEANQTFRDLERWVTAPDSRRPVGDPVITQLLLTEEPHRVLAAFQSAQLRFAPLPSFFSERFFLETAGILRQHGAARQIIHWLETQPLKTWPHRSGQDLESLLRRATLWHALKAGHFDDGAGEAALSLARELVIHCNTNSLSARREETLFGDSDPFFGRAPERVRRVLAWQTEGLQQNDVSTEDVVLNAAKEAEEYGLLLAAFAEHFVRSDSLQEAHKLARQAVQAAPYLPDALGVLAWTSHQLANPAGREELLQRMKDIVASGLARESTLQRLRRAYYKLQAGRVDAASSLVQATSARRNDTERVLARHPSLSELTRFLGEN